MAGRTDFTTEAGWEDVWLICYTLVDDTYQSLEKHYGVWRRTAPIPLFSASKKKSVLAFISQAHSSKRLIVGSMVCAGEHRDRCEFMFNSTVSHAKIHSLTNHQYPQPVPAIPRMMVQALSNGLGMRQSLR